ncbi:MAG: hypothetical protein IKU39_07250 [Lachnospiraceae bacterium]|nr:hypothetical protein [Lachnospiraceae bacterium]
MVAAVIELKSWMGTHQHFMIGETPSEIIEKFEDIQDLHCLARMGRQREETAEGQKALDKLDAFLKKVDSGRLTLRDIMKFSFQLEVGSFRCLGIAIDGEAIERLKKSYPNAG